ncbi:hypothetical protein G9A89_002813 [Geosiphon pyriformis]|nr:hypothetical protein G9A89_002813 [Geosiphon pyriformis]
MKHTPFDLTYERTAILPINFTVKTYPVQPINEENFQETLQRRAYTFFSTLEEKRRIAATHIKHFQAQQKERHNNKLPPIINEFKVENKVFLHRTKAKKQWSGKFENKWDKPFYIYEILGNGSYKLRLDDKILAKVAHRDRLKHYQSKNNPETLIPQIALKTLPDLSITINKSQINYIQKETTVPVVNHLQNYHPYRRKTKSYSENRLPRLLKQALEENLLIAPIDIPSNATMQQKLLLLLNEQNNEHTPIYKYFHIGKILYEQKLELEATNLTPEAIQKQIHNEFKTAAGPTNTYYKLRAVFRLYNLFNTCENVLQNPILQLIKV